MPLAAIHAQLTVHAVVGFTTGCYREVSVQRTAS